MELSDVYYIESEGHNLIYHTKEGICSFIRYDEICGDGDGGDGFLADQ